MDNNENLNIVMKFSADVADAKQKVEDIGKSVKKVGKEAVEINFRDLGEKLNYVGQQVSNAGRGISGMLLGSANAYIASAGQFDAKVLRWNAAQKDIEKSYARIGAVSLEKLTPYLEQAATLIDKLANFIEQNPWIVDAAVKSAGVLLSAGAVTSGIGSLMMLKGSLDKVLTFLGMGGGLAGATGAAGAGAGAVGAAGAAGAGAGAGAGAAGAAAATAVVLAASAALGGVIGRAGGNWINSMIGQKEQNWGDIANTAKMISAMVNPISLLGQGLKKLGFDEAGQKLWNFSKNINGLGDAAQQAGDKAQNAGNSLKTFAESNVQMFIDFEKEKADAAEQYSESVKQVEADAAEQRVQIIKSFAARAAAAEANYARERQQMVNANEQAKTQALNDYYRQQVEAQQTFDLDMQRMAEDHKRRLEQLEQDHNAKVKDLVADRDALGLANENDAYRRARQNENDNYATERKRREQEFKIQLAQMAQNFALAQQAREQDFREQMAARAQQHVEEMAAINQERAEALAALDENTKKTLAKLKEGYDKQQKMIQTAFIDRLNAMSQSIQGNTDAWIGYMEQTATDFQNWLRAQGWNGISGGTSSGTQGIARAAGGFVADGRTYLVGENGPELFTSRGNGMIIPAGMTAGLLGRKDQRASGGRNITVHLESKGLTMQEVLGEMDRRFGQFERAFGRAIG